MSEPKRTAAIIVAAGKGLRMGGAVPKQYLDLVGSPILGHTLRAFEESIVDDVVIVCPSGDEEYVRTLIVNAGGFTKVRAIVPGGSERFDSSGRGLAAIEGEEHPDYVLIHDGVRALVESELINRVIAGLDSAEAVCPTVKVKDTIRTMDTKDAPGRALKRELLRAVQTPQGFRYDTICEAYSRFEAERQSTGDSSEGARAVKSVGNDITDDVMLAERYTGCRVVLTEGSNSNIKITTPEDLLLAEALLERRSE